MRHPAHLHFFLVLVTLFLPHNVLAWSSRFVGWRRRAPPRERSLASMPTPSAVRMMSRDGPLVRVSLQKPLGIQLEEIKAGLPGVRVAGLVDGGTAKENGVR